MDEAIIFYKIESLKRCVDRINSKIPSSEETLFDDLDIQIFLL